MQLFQKYNAELQTVNALKDSIRHCAMVGDMTDTGRPVLFSLHYQKGPPERFFFLYRVFGNTFKVGKL